MSVTLRYEKRYNVCVTANLVLSTFKFSESKK